MLCIRISTNIVDEQEQYIHIDFFSNAVEKSRVKEGKPFRQPLGCLNGFCIFAVCFLLFGLHDSVQQVFLSSVFFRFT